MNRLHSSRCRNTSLHLNTILRPCPGRYRFLNWGAHYSTIRSCLGMGASLAPPVTLLQCLRTHGSCALSHGIDDSVGERNAPALFNLAWKSQFMWDGAIELLDHQALTPLTHPSEMGDTLPHILGKLRRNKRYRNRFSKAFGDTAISTQRLLHALAQFQLSLISDKAKYDQVKEEPVSSISRSRTATPFFFSTATAAIQNPCSLPGDL